MKIVFLDGDTLGKTPLTPIELLGELVVYGKSDSEQAKERVKDAEVLIVNKVRVTDELMSCAPKLHLICEAATGLDNIDLKAAEKRSVAVRNVAGYSTDSVVQLVFTQLLNLLVRPVRYDNYVKSSEYSASGVFTEVSRPYPQLSGMTMGIIGMGNIGCKVAAVATAFGMKVIYYATSGKSHCQDYPHVALDELLSCSDVVSLHSPLNDRTRGLIGKEQLKRMKPSAYLINMARGGIVDEQALASALDEGVIAGAAVDVFTKEPLPQDNPLAMMTHPERILLSPHVAWTSSQAMSCLVQGIADNIKLFCEEKL